jgi:hypothetical protein
LRDGTQSFCSQGLLGLSLGKGAPLTMPSSSSSSSSGGVGGSSKKRQKKSAKATRKFLKAAQRGDLHKAKKRYKRFSKLKVDVDLETRTGGDDGGVDSVGGGQTAMHLARAVPHADSP